MLSVEEFLQGRRRKIGTTRIPERRGEGEHREGENISFPHPPQEINLRGTGSSLTSHAERRTRTNGLRDVLKALVERGHCALKTDERRKDGPHSKANWALNLGFGKRERGWSSCWM